MTENDEKETTSETGGEHSLNLGSLNKDVSHPFDQTNGIVDGLEGDADDPEVFEKIQNAEQPGVPDPAVDDEGDDLSKG